MLPVIGAFMAEHSLPDVTVRPQPQPDSPRSRNIEASRRLLKLPKKAVEALKEQRRRQAAERLQAGEQWQDHDLVFCREDGTPLDRW